ncbi:MAG: hemolysin [Crocinitomicaceae bacterium]|nr:hemolysin [Crocinitomicaceae bacterium]
MDELIKRDEFADIASIGKLKMPRIAGILMNVLSINKINEFYANNAHKNAVDFVDALFEQLNIEFDIDPTELANLPKEGAFISVSNHPYGGIEGLFLIKLLLQQRPDSKVMVNFLLNRIAPLAPHIIPVNPFEDKQDLKSSFAGIKQSLHHLSEGHPIGTFPAGEVSSFQTNSKSITDREWQDGILRLIQKADVPVVPIFFHGNNSLIFQLLGSIHPALRTAKLPSEVFNKKDRKVKVRIGKPISVKEINGFEDHKQMGRFLRAKTYALGSALEVKKFYRPNLSALKKPEPIANAIPSDVLLGEIERLRAMDMRIHTQQEFEIYIAYSTDIPNILTEIGRLREITFRAMQEGTNRALDLDEYDLYYHHLFIWDKEANKLVGAYRLGKGNDIMKKYGKRGFYVHSLFRLKRKFKPILFETIELGRSFIVEEYQRKMLPLFLLWKGILYFLIKNPEYRYLMGPVTISNRYSKLSKSLMIGFIKKNFFREDLAELVRPRKKFRPKTKNVDAEIILESSKDDFKSLDKFIQEIEPERYNIPVLLKKYMKQNARIIAFNVDPKFGQALDGLMVLDMNDVPESTIEDLKKDFDIK